MGSYKAQGATSYSPKAANGLSGAPGKLLFAPSSVAQHQISQAALQNAGMQGFEESQKR